MTPEAEDGWRIKARGDLLSFSRWMFKARRGAVWQLGRHHHLLNAALLKVYAGQTKRLIINIPPRYSKTEFVVNFMAWSLGQYPDCEFIYASYSGRLAAKSSWECRSIVQHPEYQRVFPGTQLRDDSSAKDEWRTTAGGMVYAVGAGGTITGYGAGKMRPGFGGAIIVDDPHKADEASSEVMRANVWDWFQGTLESRTNNPDTPIIVIMQRLHEDDLAGHLIAGHNGEEWEVLKLPAICEDGSALWPFKHSIERLAQMQEAAPYVFSGQYMQEPAPRSGGIFKPDRIEVIDVAPACVRVCRGWDQAASNGKGDYTAGVLLGITKATETQAGEFIILDVARKQTDEPRTFLRIIAGMDNPETVQSWPQDPGAAGKDQARSIVADMAGFIIRTSPETGAKETRWEPVAAQINGGNVKMVRAPWNKALVDEMSMAPNGRNDDQLDALARAFAEIGIAATPGFHFF